MTNIFSHNISTLRGFAIAVLTAMLSLCAAPTSAETVSQKEASRLAQQFFNAANGQVMAKPKMVYNGRRLTTDRLFAPFYVYNHPAGGYVIISAENKAFPILGYSLRENFDADNIKPVLKALLTGYARDIERIRYDSRVPYEAIEAWTDYPAYVTELLSADYDATDPTMSMSEATETIDRLMLSDDADRMSASLYTPGQWREIVDATLKAERSMPIGLSDGRSMQTAIIHGHKGDYYRMELDSRNSALYRLQATEYLNDGQIAPLADAPALPLAEEEPPFSYIDSILADIRYRAADNSNTDGLLPGLTNTPPIVRGIGDGRYEIALPEEAATAFIYNIGGMQLGQRTFRDTTTAHIDLSPQPNGLYIAVIYSASGHPYSFKLVR